MINIYLRLCNINENNPDMERFVDVDRDILLLRCLGSLLQTIKHGFYSKTFNPDEIRLNLAAQCSGSFLGKVENLCNSSSKIKPIYQILDTPLGDNESKLFCYNHAMENCNGLLYFLDDDYLHKEKSLSQMINFWRYASKNMFIPVALKPEDAPYEYLPKNIVPSRIVADETQEFHWRTTVNSTFSLFFHKALLEKFWQRFMDYCKFRQTDEKLGYVTEKNTINLIFRDEAVLFSPIPTLAYHLGFIDPPAIEPPDIFSREWLKTLR